MNWKNRLTNYNFWISIFSAVLLILQALKIEFDIAYVNEIFTAVLGLLVVIGIISDPTRTTVKNSDTASVNKSLESAAGEKTESKQSEQNLKNEGKNDVLPIDKKDEVDNNDIQNDIKDVLNKLSNDLKQKIKELGVADQPEHTDNFSQEDNEQGVLEENKIEDQGEIPTPAAAEMENPYWM